MPAGLAKDRLPVVVSFMSPKPMSFTAHIDFMDEDGKRFSMPVTGTTDNSLLTNLAFIQVRGDTEGPGNSAAPPPTRQGPGTQPAAPHQSVHRQHFRLNSWPRNRPVGPRLAALHPRAHTSTHTLTAQ